MKQTALATAGIEKCTKTPRRAVFLSEMDHVVPWPILCEMIDPLYPKAELWDFAIRLSYEVLSMLVRLTVPDSGFGRVFRRQFAPDLYD